MKHLHLFETYGEDLNLCRQITAMEFAEWKERAIGCPSEEAIEIIKDQIDQVESDFSKRFDPTKLRIRKDALAYRNYVEADQYRGSSTGYMGMSPDLHLTLSECDDRWYVAEVYHNWYYYYFVCDDLVGLQKLGMTIINAIENGSIMN